MQTETVPESTTPAQGLATLAQRHGFGEDAVRAMWDAVVQGRGAMAQFSHAEFGGRGQWMRNGMVMIGDMFNRPLAARVGALCDDLARSLAEHPALVGTADQRPPNAWWPAGLTQPAATGAQNDMRYAWFPLQRRLAIEREGRLELYDTAHHEIGGVAQQQGTNRTIRFTSQDGLVDLDTLERLAAPQAPSPEAPAEGPAADTPASIEDQAGGGGPHLSPVARRTAPADPVRETVEPLQPGPQSRAPDAGARPGVVTVPFAAVTPEQVLQTLARLGDLYKAGVLTDAEFQHKKSELLDRL